MKLWVEVDPRFLPFLSQIPIGKTIDMSSVSRRIFLSTTSSATLTGVVGLEPSLFPALQAQETRMTPEFVRFRPEIEPLVQLMETTPRESMIDKVLAEIRSGTTYRELLSALFLAGIRNVQPRPAVGFKFHTVLVVHAAHQASMAASDSARWLPLLWSIDYFKSAQASDEKEGDWTMPAVDASRIPSPERSLDLLQNAFEKWDEGAADVAAAAVVQVASATQLLDLYAKYAARDFRSIGHKAIYVAGAFRTLSVIGWEHAEPVMRSLAYAILNHTGEKNPSENDYEVDRAGRSNWEIVDSIPKQWMAGTPDESASQRVLELLRKASPTEASKAIVEMLQAKIHPRSIFDGILLASSELVSRQPAIVPLHAVTTTNAMHYLFHQVHDDRLRRWLLLQNASFLAHFREAANLRDKMVSNRIDSLRLPDGNRPDLNAIFDQVAKDRNAAATQVFHFMQSGGELNHLMHKARELVFLKGTDSHDYKFSSAALEDAWAMSPRWRPYYLAGCSYLLHGTSEKTTSLSQKVLAAS